jgi:hypothetical protein
MPDEFEDPIEAIKRRNEERAKRLKERIASGEFDGFETRIEEVDEMRPGRPAPLGEPEPDFDLSSFPSPPPPAPMSFDEPPPPPEFGAPAEPVSAPGSEMPLSSEPEFAGVGAADEEPTLPPPAAGAVSDDVFGGIELPDLSLEVEEELLMPQTWDAGEEEAVAPEAVEAEAGVGAEERAGIEIEVEAGAPAEFEPVMPEAPVEFGVTAPGIELPAEIEAAMAPAEPSIREEEAEAIKATIDSELREIPPAAPPMPPRRVERPRPPVEPPAEAVPAGPPPAAEPATVFVGIEVKGNKVRIERRNITLAGAIELFQAIVDRYENR